MSGNRVSSLANYSGSHSSGNQNIKYFYYGNPNNLAVWKNMQYINDVSGSTPFFIPKNKTLITPAVTKTASKVSIPVYISTDLYVAGTIYGTLGTSSDEKLKDNIQTISDLKISEFIHLEPKEFTYKSEPLKKHFGFIAQDVEKIYPELVSTSDNGYKSVNYIEIIPLLVAKINAMQKQIDSLINI
jgi:hypothetical protein